MIKGGTPKGRLALPEFLVSLLLIFAAWTARGCVAGGGSLPEDRGASDSAGTVAVLFTAPDGSVPAGEVAEKLIEAISQAEEQIDVAVYRLELEDVAEALVAAQSRGVRVRMVTEADYMDEAAVARLQEANISVISDSDDPFMHNKFVVIDGLQVWTGSWNWAYSETYRNDNNVVILTSSRLAQNYTVEFEEMFEDRRFGEDSPENTPYPQLQIGGTLVETVFEPEGDGRTRILELLGGAQESIHFMAFS
ncbi:MAG: phospholipase D-like domain-containing protein, partial [Anaerolineae bacterium]|nr:phospholipase D-like domain-containing protein [Anaerolineae bacterium]